MFLTPNAVSVNGAPAGVIVVGSAGDEPGIMLMSGRLFEGPGEAVTDEALVELELGDEFVLAGRQFTVVGTVEHATWDIATAGLFIDRAEAHDMLTNGQNVVTAIAIDGDGELPTLPAGVSVQTREQAFDDVVSRTADAKRSIDAFKVTLWVLAIVIVGAVLYLAAIERVRDFAIFKATGAGNLDLVFGLGLQAAIVGVIAGVMSIGLAHLMKPVYPGLLSLPFAVAWPVVPVSVVIAVLSSIVGVRRAIKVDPSQAFG
jgi:putative ABC transport system permease protein